MPAKKSSRRWLVAGCAALILAALSLLLAGQVLAQGGIILDGIGDDWDPSWLVATDPLDVFITGSSPPAHPHDPPYLARSGYDATGVWAHYQATNDRWYFRIDVDGRPADSDSATGTTGNLGVGTHDVDGGPLAGDSTGIGLPEAYRLWFRFEPGAVQARAELGADPTILPGVISPTTLELTGQAVYSTTFAPGVLEWAFPRQEILPTGSAYNEMWLWAQMGDNSDRVSDDDVAEALVIALDLEVLCPDAPLVAGDRATFPLDYTIPASAALGVTDVVLTATVPEGTRFRSASDGGSESGGIVTWNLGDLSPGDAGRVSMTLRLSNPPDPLNILSELTSAEGLRHQADNECPVLQPTFTNTPTPTPTNTPTPTPTPTNTPTDTPVTPEDTPIPPTPTFTYTPTPTATSTLPPSEKPPVVPEPATLTLMLTAMGGLTGYAALQWRARRRR